MSGHQRSLTIVVLILLISALAPQLMRSTLPSILRVHATNRTIALTATYPYWNSSSPPITVTQGDTVTMVLSSADGLPAHKFLVDLDGDGSDTTDCPATDPCSASFSTSTTYTFTVSPTLTPGTYKYICTIHYPYMVGNFVVQAPATPDFTIASSPTSLNIPQGSSGTATITLTSVNSFSGTVTLTPTVSASGPQVSLNTTSVTLSSGGTASATLTAKTASSGLYSSPVPTGSYTVTVNGASGTQSHTATLSITVGSGSSSPFGAGNLPTSLIIGVVVAAIAAVAVAIYLVKRRPKTKPSTKPSVS